MVRGLTVLPPADQMEDPVGMATLVEVAELVSASADGTLRLWNVESGYARVIQAHNSWVNRWAISC
eukprot:scaffold651952_cov48-Prasinocladus_malaysianus.AAC.1